LGVRVFLGNRGGGEGGGGSSALDCCRRSLEHDNCDEALSVKGVEEMLPEYEKSLLVKLLLATSDYDVFVSMMRELNLESDFSPCGDVAVEGTAISSESQEVMVGGMDKNQTGILGEAGDVSSDDE